MANAKCGRRLGEAVLFGIFDKVYAAFRANLGETLVSRQRSVAGVNRVSFANLRRGDDALPITGVALNRPANTDCLICELDMFGMAILLRIDRNYSHV